MDFCPETFFQFISNTGICADIGKKFPTPVRYKLIDHTADLGIRVWGHDAPDLFRNAALALADILTEVRRVQGDRTCGLRVTGHDWQDLMVNWLGEVLYLWAGREMLLQDVSVICLRENEIKARVRYEPYSPLRHVLKNEIKAVTYHQIAVFERGGRWQAQVVFDV
jgi:SHS2 domain-containing protein